MAEKILASSSWKLPPTREQCQAITRYCLWLGIREELELKPSTRIEARNQLYDLRLEMKKRQEGY